MGDTDVTTPPKLLATHEVIVSSYEDTKANISANYTREDTKAMTAAKEMNACFDTLRKAQNAVVETKTKELTKKNARRLTNSLMLLAKLRSSSHKWQRVIPSWE